MPIEHVVKAGECLSSIAYQYDLFPETIWNDPANADLKSKRKNPNILLVGDTVIIPDKRSKTVDRRSEARHQFRRKGVPETLYLRLVDEFDEPKATVTYYLFIDGESRQGTTNTDGELKEMIAPDAKKAMLVIQDGEEKSEVVLELGHLDPITEISGIQARLANLEYYHGPIDGIFEPQTRAAIRRFQCYYNLEATGEADQVTLRKLEKVYGG